MPFVFTDTNTERVDFRKHFGGNPKFPKAYQQTLNEARQKVCDTLASQPSSQPLLDAIDEYLPHLLAMIDIAEKDRLVEIEYSWKSVLTVGVISGLGKNKASDKKSIKLASIYFEAVYMMLAYALALANMAGKKVGSQPALTSESALNEAIDMYARAAGILSTVGLTWATRWNGPSVKNRPPETTPAGLACLAEFMLLEAQILAALKAEKRGMSAATLVKVQRGALEKFETIKSNLRGAKGDWSDSFLAYVNEGSLLYEALMLKKYAAFAHSEDKNGIAVACMTRCFNLFTIDLKTVKTPYWAKLHADHKDELRQLLDTYVRINNNVTYQRIPNDEDMFAGLPSAISMVERKAFVMPEAAEIPAPSEEELAAATAAMSLNKQDGKNASTSSTSDKASSPPPSVDDDQEESAKPAGPKASVRDAFKSLLKTEKKDVQ